MGKQLSKKSQKNRSKKTQRNMKKVKLTKKQKRRTNKHYKKRRTNRKKYGVKRGGSAASNRSANQQDHKVGRATKSRKLNLPVQGALVTAPHSTKILAIIHLLSLSGQNLFALSKPRAYDNNRLIDRNLKRIKFMEDTLMYFNNADAFKTSIESLMTIYNDKFIKIQATMQQILHEGSIVEDGIVTTYSFPFQEIIIDYYYVAYVSKMNEIGLGPVGKNYFIQSTYNRFCATFYETINNYIGGVTTTANCENIINKLYGEDPEIFLLINEKMKETNLNASAESGDESFTFSLTEIDLQHNLIAKEHFYNILTTLINNATSTLGEDLDELFNSIQVKMNGLYTYLEPIIRKVNAVVQEQIDPVLWRSAIGRIQRNINHYVSSMQLYAHQQMLDIYSSSEGDNSIVRLIGNKLRDKSYELINNINGSFNDVLRLPITVANTAAKNIVTAIEKSGLLYELHGITGIFMLDAFIKSHKCVIDEAKLATFESFVDRLKDQNERVKTKINEQHTVSLQAGNLTDNNSEDASDREAASDPGSRVIVNFSKYNRPSITIPSREDLGGEDLLGEDLLGEDLPREEDTPLLQHIGSFVLENISKKITKLQEAVENNNILG